MEPIEKLLQDVWDIHVRYEAHYRETGEQFNIFDIAGIAHNEVIFCRVIRELLCPHGRHYGAWTLYPFVQGR